MHPSTSDLRISATRPLLAPAVLEEECPLDDAGSLRIARARRDIASIMSGADDRLLVVVGPCSIHDPAAAVEFAGLLRAAADRHPGDLLVAMRVYFEKPRTVVGWKGLINDPDLDGSFRIDEGLRVARGLLLDIPSLRGLPWLEPGDQVTADDLLAAESAQAARIGPNLGPRPSQSWNAAYAGTVR